MALAAPPCLGLRPVTGALASGGVTAPGRAWIWGEPVGRLDGLRVEGLGWGRRISGKQDEKKGLVYAARIRLKQHVMRIDGREVPLGAGMNATV